MPSFDQTPDKPQSFGYKVSWFAVKAAGPGPVLDSLQCGEGTPANWASGLAVAAEGGSEAWVFVSPPVSGWVLIVGRWLPHPAVIGSERQIGRKFDILFSRLMQRFDEVQFFGSYRVVGFVAWARALMGKPMRIF